MTGGGDWARLDELLDGALEQSPERRREWLATACGGDDALRSRVEMLLDLAEREDGDLVPSGGLRGTVWEEVARELDADPADLVPPGSRLGPYEVRELIGAGGMGRVYRAYDPVLRREVAIKALSSDLASDGTSFRRFEREARLLATLSHPNIASIHGLHSFEGQPYLVLELVEGPTLDERIARGALPAAEAVRVARQVAEALEEAHGKGIVHRDLKPSNVKLGRGGRVKVLDFGLARRITRDAATEVSAAGTLTREGTILGTVPYMSPEQARGEEVDARTDVWALGCLLYEMLTGRRAFEGRTVSELLAAVLRDDVDLGQLPAATPPALRRLVRRCLGKDPHRRLQHVGDARLELEELEAGDGDGGGAKTGPTRFAGLLPWAVAGLAVVVAGVSLLGLPERPAERSGGVRRLVLDLPSGVALPTGDYASPLALSPDGLTAVLLGEDEEGGRLYRRSFDGLDWVALAGTEGAWQPFFSPDGREVGFFADRRLRRVSFDGTAPTTVAEIGANPRGASWAPDGTIVLGPSQTSGLVRVDARGGVPRPLTELDRAMDERSHRWPQVLPGGREVLFTIDFEESTFDDAALGVVSLETGERRTLLRGGAHGRYVPSGHVVYARGGRLFAVPFDLARLVVTGTPIQVIDGVAYDLRNGGTKVAVAGDGTLAYVPGLPGSLDRRLVWVDAQGERRPVTNEAWRFLDPRLSPDGRRVAVRIGDPARSDVWTFEVERSTLSQLTFGLATFHPTWTPDGRGLTIGVHEDGSWRLVTVGSDGQGPEVTLLEGPNRLYPGAWSSDGRTLVYQERRADSGWDVLALDVDASGRPQGPPEPLLDTPANETNPALSPAGDLLAFESDEMDGLVSVFVRPFRRPGASLKVSSGGGRWPHWGRPGELFYWSWFTRRMYRVAHRIRDGRLAVDSEEVLWAAPAEAAVEVPVSEHLGFGFDLDPRGRRFLMMESAARVSPPPPPRMVLALGWAEELQTRRP